MHASIQTPSFGREAVIRLPLPRVRILLAEQRELLRSGLQTLIQALDNVEIIGEAASGDDCLEAALQLQPQVVVAPVQLPGVNGIDLVRRLRAIRGAPRTVLMGHREAPGTVAAAVHAGVCGMVMQCEHFSELAAAIRAAGEHRLYLSPLANAAFAEAAGRGAMAAALTPRQREVVQLLAEGLSTKQVAFRLELSIKTIATHREQILERLKLRGIADLTRYAIRAGLIEA